MSQVHREIWESLVSMLRVYANAASLGGRDYLVTSSGEEAWVKHEDHLLSICFRAEKGTWCMGQTRGEFGIEEDGTLTFPDGAKALDEAAIEWMEQLGAAHLRVAQSVTSFVDKS